MHVVERSLLPVSLASEFHRSGSDRTDGRSPTSPGAEDPLPYTVRPDMDVVGMREVVTRQEAPPALGTALTDEDLALQPMDSRTQSPYAQRGDQSRIPEQGREKKSSPDYKV